MEFIYSSHALSSFLVFKKSEFLSYNINISLGNVATLDLPFYPSDNTLRTFSASTMDEDTVNLIIALQMEDLDLLISGQKGKAIEGSALADNQIAVELQKAELQKQETMLADLRIARSISRAVQDDGATVAILTAEERRCAQDRETACRLSGQPHHHALNLPDCRVEDDILARFGSLNIRQADNKDEDDDLSCYGESVVSFNEQESGENSSWAAGRKTGNSKGESKAKSKCVACSDTQDTLQAPCQHHYCKKCVIRLVGDSTVDESLFPPRCCGQEMPMSLFRPYITAELTAKFERKAIELGTAYRTYCYSCGIFINSDGIQGHQAHCITCNRNTCMLCKCKFHGGDCPKDLALEAVLELARGTGWQRCTNCQAMIERREGCNHIT